MHFGSKALLGLFVAVTMGCTAPQSGLFAKEWCQAFDPARRVTAPAFDAHAFLMLDDMEDGDQSACPPVSGRWSAAPEELGSAADPSRAGSFRAQHLAGTADAPGVLTLSLGGLDLGAYSLEIDFWARSSGDPLTLTVTVVTASITDGDYFSTTVNIGQDWGSGASYSVALANGLTTSTGQAATTADFASVSELRFQVVAPPTSPFGFWIDDIEAKGP